MEWGCHPSWNRHRPKNGLSGYLLALALHRLFFPTSPARPSTPSCWEGPSVRQTGRSIPTACVGCRKHTAHLWGVPAGWCPHHSWHSWPGSSKIVCRLLCYPSGKKEMDINEIEGRRHEAGAPQPNIPQPEFPPSQFWIQVSTFGSGLVSQRRLPLNGSTVLNLKL